MKPHVLAVALSTLLLAAPVAAQAQGIVGGAQRGANQGDDAAGPVGAVVGGAVGAVVGGVDGLLGVRQRPRFREYVVNEHVPSYAWTGEVQPGVVLPDTGITYYEVPAGYGVRSGYRYTVINGETVLVDPATRRVVQVVDAGPGPTVAATAPVAPAPAVLLAPDQRPRFREYVMSRRLPSYRYAGDVRTGIVLPPAGVQFYPAPSRFGVTQYRYTVVNNEPVLVDPGSRRIVEVVE